MHVDIFIMGGCRERWSFLAGFLPEAEGREDRRCH
jgi:hypothetical protein